MHSKTVIPIEVDLFLCKNKTNFTLEGGRWKGDFSILFINVLEHCGYYKKFYWSFSRAFDNLDSAYRFLFGSYYVQYSTQYTVHPKHVLKLRKGEPKIRLLSHTIHSTLHMNVHCVHCTYNLFNRVTFVALYPCNKQKIKQISK